MRAAIEHSKSACRQVAGHSVSGAAAPWNSETDAKWFIRVFVFYRHLSK